MTTKYFLLVLIFFSLSPGCKQNIYSDLNLDFEKVENRMPKGWQINVPSKDFSVSMDSTIVKSGKYAMSIEFTGEIAGMQNGILLITPEMYQGNKITLSGYIKTENVTQGWAGLGMLLNYEQEYLDMSNNGITGTTDWQKYEISLNMNPTLAQSIIIGVLLEGNGKIWVDDLRVTIDGKDIQKIQLLKPKPFSENAKKDNEFDKGANIVFPELTEQKLYDLELLGRIWGFLKYHHPAISKGKYNWDNELFRLLPAYLNVDNDKQRDKILIKWINKYGRIPKCKNCKATPEDAFLKPDLSWIEDSDINLKLKDLLYKVYLNRNQGNHYYINISPMVSIPLFTNEKTYESINFPDTGLRLLALYRYWNMIHYFSPYKYLTDKDWNTVLREYIPCFLDAKNRQEYRIAATLLIAEVCDSHSTLEDESINTDLQVSAKVRFIENKLVVIDDYYSSPQLKKGDIITQINGKPVEAIVDSVKKYFPASNEAARMRDIARKLTRFPFEAETPRSYRFIDKDIGYITFKTIKHEDIPTIKKEFIDTKGIIIDIRNYPALENLVDNLARYFISNTTPFAKFTIGNMNNPGEFTFSRTNKIHRWKDYIYQGKLVVIVNEETQSMAEYTAMALRAGDHTTIIGSQTAGADGNVSAITLPGGLKTRISGIGIYYPDGRETQRIGIIPDIEIRPTIQGIREGRDELLEKAIEIIKQHY